MILNGQRVKDNFMCWFHYKKKGCFKWAFKYSPRAKIISNDLYGDFSVKFY